jgi:hypothetical protein
VQQISYILKILEVDRLVKSQGVPKLLDIGGLGSFPQHLENGVTGDQVDEEEDEGDDDKDAESHENKASKKNEQHNSRTSVGGGYQTNPIAWPSGLLTQTPRGPSLDVRKLRVF